MMSKESAPVKGFEAFGAGGGGEFITKKKVLPTEITRSP